jgi:diguanylate cyclase (GGDEF)-like protein
LPSVKHVSARFLSIYYIIALVMIAGMFTGAHVALVHVLSQDRGAAQVINLSSRQRMLCQRIAMLAGEYRLGDAGAQREILPAIAALRANEDTLKTVLDTSRADSATLALRQLYRTALDPQVNDFIANARLVASLPAQSPAMAQPLAWLFNAADGPLMDNLDKVVSIHEMRTEQVLRELETLQFTVLVTILLTLTVEVFTIFRPMIRRIEHYTGEVTRLATIDSLTDLPNRRGFLDLCEAECRRAERHHRDVSVLMVDVDNFKTVNDAHGHAGGDAALRHLADLLREALRQSDIAGRFGGEEFTVLLPETDLAGAGLLAERLRQRIAEAHLSFNGQVINFTVSIGVAPVVIGVAPGGLPPIEQALNRADQALYHAKRAGRNQVVCA